MTTLITALPLTSSKGPTVTQVEEIDLLESEAIYTEKTVVPEPKSIPSRWLIASPYLEREHHLNLDTINTPCQLLAQALTSLAPVTSSYAITPYSTCLNWPDVFGNLRSLSAENGYSWPRTEFYVVEFRSKLKAKIDNQLLFKLDKESHREATASGGLLKYWFGSPDEERRNLATCLWRSKEDAILGGKGPWHKQARAITAQMYESIDVKGLKLMIEDDISSWNFEPFGFR